MNDPSLVQPCCIDEDRIGPATTRDGREVADLHRHEGMLRGFVQGLSKATFWYPNGRLTPLATTPTDLVEGGC